MPDLHTVAALLGGDIHTGSQVTVRGWLRSKRDSKAGISFLAVHDGSAFDPIQAVVPDTLDNYQSEVLHLSTGCAVIVSGELVASQGKGQSVEIQASRVEVVGPGRRPGDLPHRQEAPHLRIPAHPGAPAPSHQHLRRHHPCAHDPGQRHSQLLLRARLPLDQHPHYHRERLRGRRRALPGQYAGSRQPAAHRRRRGRFPPGLFRGRIVSHRVRAVWRSRPTVSP